MKIFFAPTFKKFYERLPKRIKIRTDQALSLLGENPRHPSLHTKKMGGSKHIWEARVTLSYRLTFAWIGDQIIVRKVGPHDILREED